MIAFSMAHSTPPSPEVAVVTVSYGSDSVLPAFLGSVQFASARPLQVVVADNRDGSGDRSVERIAGSFGADYLPLGANLGYGAAVNAAVAALPRSVGWVLISNPDVVMHRGALDRLLESAMANQRIAAVGPAIYTGLGVLYPSAREIPSLWTGVGHALFANVWTANPWTRSYRGVESNSRRNAGWLSGACLLVQRSAFEEVGGFDPNFFMYFEDVDLGYRFGRAGYYNLYEPAASVTHTGAHSTSSAADSMVRVHHLSAIRFLGKRYPGRLRWPVRAALSLSLSVRSTLIRRSARER